MLGNHKKLFMLLKKKIRLNIYSHLQRVRLTKAPYLPIIHA